MTGFCGWICKITCKMSVVALCDVVLKYLSINSFAAAGGCSRHPGLTPQATSRQRALSAGVDRSRHNIAY